MRFGLTGAFVFGVYTGGTLLLSGPLGLPIVLAIGLALLVALAVNFTMQRHFVFLDHDTFALSTRTQLARYPVATACNYAFDESSSSPFPTPSGCRRSSCSWSPRW